MVIDDVLDPCRSVSCKTFSLMRRPMTVEGCGSKVLQFDGHAHCNHLEVVQRLAPQCEAGWLG